MLRSELFKKDRNLRSQKIGISCSKWIRISVRIHKNTYADLQPAGFDWITALRGDTLRKLVKRNVVQPGLFDTPDLASVTCQEYPGERLLVCYNPLVAAERRRKRNVLLELTEADAGVQEPGAGGVGLPVAEVAAGGAVRAGQAQGPHARDAGGEPAAAELPGPAGTPDDALGAGVAAGGGSGAPCVEAERADAVAGAGVPNCWGASRTRHRPRSRERPNLRNLVTSGAFFRARSPVETAGADSCHPVTNNSEKRDLLC